MIKSYIDAKSNFSAWNWEATIRLHKMNLKFAHHGLQFFFITLCVEGRRKILSRIVDEKSRPIPSARGECVVALWRHLHVLNPALTASNSVIMPDHVHLLLVVNFDRDPTFRPLVFIHWFMEETERMMAAKDGGSAPAPLPSSIRNDFHPSAEVLPAGARGRQPQIEDEMLPAGARGRQPPSFAIWNRSFWLDLSFSSRQLKAIRRYIRLNPARALWKMRHPDRFQRHAAIRHPILAANRTWDAIGNLTLLGSPLLFPVRLTRKKTPEEHAAAIEEIVEKARRGMIPVSGFLSPGEKEALRRLKAEPRARFIKMRPCALPPHYDPSAEDSRELAADRLLIISGFPQSITDAGGIFRANCLLMNDLITEMCAKAQTADFA